MAYGTKIALLFFRGLSEEHPPRPEDQCQGEILEHLQFEESEDEEVMVTPSDSDDSVKQQIEVTQKTRKNHVVAHTKYTQVNIEEMLFQRNAAATAEKATTPKKSWKARNATFNQAKQIRVRTNNRTPGRRHC